ncbi:hypothetical protein [Thalassotalea profundi]|uniref:DUF2884 family protein n=1 Tax=Thalassotalea profundi TaxID=2036687 RepID=A0ABQ3IIM7_9GAMM|nr:hypothetical protein [Thalassotalea profundi]GHE82722.1 hypothetical protein GCM10011501_08760 [Thalassotalea profundi]
MKNSMIKPLMSACSALTMCLAFMINTTVNATQHVNEITITKGSPIENTLFVVNGRNLLWQDLTSQQQQSVKQYFHNVDNLENELQNSTKMIDDQSALIDHKVDQLELLLGSSIDKDLQDKIRQLENEIAAITATSITIDQSIIDNIESEVLKVEQLLIIASGSLSNN